MRRGKSVTMKAAMSSNKERVGVMRVLIIFEMEKSVKPGVSLVLGSARPSYEHLHMFYACSASSPKGYGLPIRNGTALYDGNYLCMRSVHSGWKLFRKEGVLHGGPSHFFP